MTYPINWLTSALLSLLRLGTGVRGDAGGERPPEPLILYEFEGCPFCRKAREAVTAFDLEVEIRPCPKRGERYRPELLARGGKAQFPYLVDPNVGDECYESSEIIRRLSRRYGRRGPPWLLRLGPLTNILAAYSQLARIGAGTYPIASRPAEQPLRLSTFEASPGGRLVRERLCSLELPYRLRTTGFGGAGRAALAAEGNPVDTTLEDPNTGDRIVGARACLDHLDRHYRA